MKNKKIGNWNDVPPKQYPVAANDFIPSAFRASTTLSRVGRVFSWVWFGNQVAISKLLPGLRASGGMGSPLR